MIQSDIDRSFNDTEREILAQYLAEANLGHANVVSEPVVVSSNLYGKFIKRAIDIVVSGMALVITLPINIVIAVGTFIDVGTPILFHQKRIGRDCKEFDIVKFRNMTNETDANGNLLLPKDRVTKWGRFVRKTSLDELLNFWSVFKGDMSLIGPRPLLVKYLPRYTERHRMRHAVRPGLECPRISNVDPSGSKWEQQFENDIWYVENLSFTTDVKMFIGLVKLVFNKRETASRGDAKRGAFMGYDEYGKAMNNVDIPEEFIIRMRREYGYDISAETLATEEREMVVKGHV